MVYFQWPQNNSINDSLFLHLVHKFLQTSYLAKLRMLNEAKKDKEKKLILGL